MNMILPEYDSPGIRHEDAPPDRPYRRRGLEAEADSLAELFEAMGEGMAGLICPRQQVEAKETARVELAAEDTEGLLVDFLSRILYLIQTRRLLVAKVSVERVDERSVAATVAGETYDPARHTWGTEIKAVTYHQLKAAQEGGTWRGRVILICEPGVPVCRGPTEHMQSGVGQTVFRSERSSGRKTMAQAYEGPSSRSMPIDGGFPARPSRACGWTASFMPARR